eukprot:1866817-Ditylum_brightwellii.AAC.1
MMMDSSKATELKGFIFDMSHVLQANIYVCTSKEIAQYAGQTCKIPDEFRHCIENLEEPMMMKPSLAVIKLQNGDAARKLNDSIATIYMSKAIDMYLKTRKTFEENKSKTFVAILGQCTDPVVSNLKIEVAWKITKAKAMWLSCSK